jgi:hypothetical protein
MDHGKGAGTTEPAPVGPAGDAGPIKPGGTKTVLRPYSPPDRGVVPASLCLRMALGLALRLDCKPRTLRSPQAVAQRHGRSSSLASCHWQCWGFRLNLNVLVSGPSG